MNIDYDDTLSSKELDMITEITFNLPNAEIPDAIEQLSTAGGKNCSTTARFIQPGCKTSCGDSESV